MPRRKACRYSPEDLEKHVQGYFDMCSSTVTEAGKARELKKPPTLEGLGAYLGLSLSTLKGYMHGEYPSKTGAERQQVADFLERAKDYMASEVLEGAMVGRYDAKICTMVLNGLGYGEQSATPASAAKIIVEWKGVSAEEMQSWAE